MKAHNTNSEAASDAHSNITDFQTEAFNKPEVMAICGPYGPRADQKDMIILGANMMREWMLEQQKHQATERAFTLATLLRFFSPNKAAEPESMTSKSLLGRMTALAVILPVVTALMLGAASYRANEVAIKANEVASWKSVSDAKKEMIDLLKDELTYARNEVRELQAKNDDLQDQIRTILEQAAKDNRVDAKTLADIRGALARAQNLRFVTPDAAATATSAPAVK